MRRNPSPERRWRAGGHKHQPFHLAQLAAVSTRASVMQLTRRSHPVKRLPRTTVCAMRLGELIQQGIELIRAKPLHRFTFRPDFEDIGRSGHHWPIAKGWANHIGGHIHLYHLLVHPSGIVPKAPRVGGTRRKDQQGHTGIAPPAWDQLTCHQFAGTINALKYRMPASQPPYRHPRYVYKSLWSKDGHARGLFARVEYFVSRYNSVAYVCLSICGCTPLAMPAFLPRRFIISRSAWPCIRVPWSVGKQ